MPSHNCNVCGKIFTRKYNMMRHQREHDEDVLRKCAECGKTFSRQDMLERHEETVHKSTGSSRSFQCEKCGKMFNRNDNLQRHQKLCTNSATVNCERQSSESIKPNSLQANDLDMEQDNNKSSSSSTSPRQQFSLKKTPKSNFVELEKAMRGQLKSLRLQLSSLEEKDDLLNVLKWSKKYIRRRLRSELDTLRSFKWSLCVQVRLIKYNNLGEMSSIEPHFRSRSRILLRNGEIKAQLNEVMLKIPSSFSDFQQKGSGWVLSEVLSVDLHLARYSPLKGSSYLPLPSFIRNNKAVINIQNNDLKCFEYSILAKLHPKQQHAERVSKYRQHFGELDFSGISFPVTLDKIPKFENQNERLSVNVYGVEQREIFPLYISDHRARETHVNLLLITEGEKSHYCLIKNLNRFLFHQTAHKNQKHFCPFCLHGFTRKNLLDNHIDLCAEHSPQTVIFPEEGDNILKFQKISKQLKVPFVIYADFESILEPIESTDQLTSQNNSISSTTKYQQHIPCGFSYMVVSTDKNLCKPPVTYRGNDVAETFLRYLQEEESEIQQILDEIIPIRLTEHDEQNFQNATTCHICEKEFNAEDEKVRDHNHLTGDYTGAAHNSCNLNYQFTDKIPVIIHNARNYDTHLILQSLGKFHEEKITCVPTNMEKYISFSLGKLTFIDSYQFMSTSLAKLVENLAHGGTSKFRHVCANYPDPNQVNLLLRKGVYPYEYITSEDVFDETCLPPKYAFYSSLTDEHISNEDYQHAQDVWDAFEMKDLGQYHDLYLTTDVLLLADVFEEFREVCIDNYKLDPCHYLTVPGLAWDAMLKLTGVELELLTCPTMFLFFENAIRGGISTVTNRYSKANNPYIPDYDVDKPTTYITYLDCNNLYGASMSESLPTNNFHWLNQNEIDNLNILDIPDDSSEGYVLECDLKYPDYLHDSHSDYPLAPEKLNVPEENLSPYCKQLLNQLGVKFTSNIKKLIPNLGDKEKYIVHYRNLKLYLSLGIELTKTHRVIGFNQSPWLKPYIDFNTSRRKAAVNTFEKDFYKLLNNSVFGKGMENIRLRILVELLTDQEKVRKRIASPSFESFRLFPNDLVAIHRRKTKVLLNKPIYIGFAVLELSKAIMYNFHYNYIKEEYGAKARLLFTDTDSLCYEIQTDDFYDDMLHNLDLYDTSDFPVDNILHSTINNKKIGCFKDETNSCPVVEFVGLRSKMYSMWYEENGLVKEKKAAKGVSKSVTKKKLKHQKYKQCLLRKKIIMAKMNQIRSKNHQLFTVSLNKIGLSPFDDKRYILGDGCNTLAYHHYTIRDKII